MVTIIVCISIGVIIYFLGVLTRPLIINDYKKIRSKSYKEISKVLRSVVSADSSISDQRKAYLKKLEEFENS